jgi:hypothetical protein
MPPWGPPEKQGRIMQVMQRPQPALARSAPGPPLQLLAPQLPLRLPPLPPHTHQGCNPKNDKDGNPVHWGAVDYKDLFGPEGWCNADMSKFQ